MRTLLLLAACLAGCASPGPGREATGSASVRIDAALPVVLQDATALAADKWAAHGFEVSVAVVPTEEANVLEGPCAERAAGCAWPHDRVHVALEQLEACNWAKVDGVTTCERMSFEFMILHELGHLLGIDHHLPDGNVMQEGATIPMPPAELTQADVEALRLAQE